MTLKINKLLQNIILLAVLLTPIFSIAEITALFNGTLSSQAESLTPSYIKAIKDVIFLALIGVGFIQIIISKRLFFNKYYYLFFAFLILSLLLSMLDQDKLLLLAGIRWIIPFSVIMFIYKIIDDKMQSKIARVLIFLFFIGLVIQAFQLFYLKNWFGINIFGLSARNPGFYLIPSSMAMFSLMTMYYAYHFYKKNTIRFLIINVFGPLSVLLTASGTGVAVLALFLMFNVYNKVKQKIIVIQAILLIIVSIAVLLPYITGRDGIYTSLMIRMMNFLDIVNLDKVFISPKFGDATNTAILLSSSLGSIENSGFIADSTIISIIGNTGFVSVLLFLLFILKPIKIQIKHLHFALIFFVFMITTIIFELFPANLLFSVNMAYYYGRNRGIIKAV